MEKKVWYITTTIKTEEREVLYAAISFDCVCLQINSNLYSKRGKSNISIKVLGLHRKQRLTFSIIMYMNVDIITFLSCSQPFENYVVVFFPCLCYLLDKRTALVIKNNHMVSAKIQVPIVCCI